MPLGSSCVGEIRWVNTLVGYFSKRLPLSAFIPRVLSLWKGFSLIEIIYLKYSFFFFKFNSKEG